MRVISVQSLMEGVDLSPVAIAIAIEHQRLGSRVVAVDTNFERRTLTGLIDAGFYHIGDVRRLVQHSCTEQPDLTLMPKLAVWGYAETSQEIRLGNGKLAVRAGISAMDPEMNWIGPNFHWLKHHFDILVIDVVPEDRKLMDIITFQSGEIHVIVRDNVPGATLKDWRTRFAKGNSCRSRKVLAVSEGDVIQIAAHKTPGMDGVPVDAPRSVTPPSAEAETASSHGLRARKRFELTVDRVLGDRIRSSSTAAQEMWSALANIEWISADGREARYSFREAGTMVAWIREEGDYMDWYCSGPTETVAPWIEDALHLAGWSWLPM